MAWPRHWVWLAGLACACAASALIGCSAAGVGPLTCNPPPQRTWAIEVTSAGEVRWQTPLPMQEGILGEGTAPLAAGSIAIFSQDDVLYALRLADGHRVWSWPGSQPIQDVFQWQGLVVVYATGSRMASLTGLDAATGQIRWTRQIAEAVPGDVAATADGGLAMFPELQVVNLSDGRVRWTRPDGVAAMAVSGTSVLVAGNGRLTSYDDQTGKVRWTEALTPIQLAATPGELGLEADAGLAYLTGVQPAATGPGTPVLLGINAVNGQLKWRFTPAPAVSVKTLGPGLVSVESGNGITWLDDLSPATGRLRWRLAITGSTGQTLFAGGQLIAVTSTASTGAGSSERSWAVPRGLLTAIRSADGHRAWQVTLPTVVSFPLPAVPGGLLVYAAAIRLPC
jgi:outer membrane protein assembly factor BamB